MCIRDSQCADGCKFPGDGADAMLGIVSVMEDVGGVGQVPDYDQDGFQWDEIPN